MFGKRYVNNLISRSAEDLAGCKRALITALLGRGFTKPIIQQQANLEDVFLDLTGHELRED